MDSKTLIDTYINDVGARLPRRLRDDVGLELRTLLTEQLHASADDAGRAPDGELALEVVRRFGRPDEVAARYEPRRFDLIEPGYAPVFVKLAAVCVGIQWGLTLPRVFLSVMTFGEWWLRWGFTAFVWVGVLVTWFGIASWVRRRWPALGPWTHWLFWVPMPADWRPVDREAIAWRAATNCLPVSAALTIFLSTPVWFLDHLLPAGTYTSWALYDESFRRWLLLPLIALMSARWLLFTAAVIAVRLRAPTEGVRFALWVVFIGLLWWTLLGWPIFASGVPNALFKAWLSIFLLINTIQIIVWIRRAVTRVRIPNL
jgi:hypothetical protein